jgi:diacylglycerol kinase (ATP)
LRKASQTVYRGSGPAMKTVVIVNPKAGKRVFLNLYLPQVLRILKRAGIRYHVLYTRYEGHATRIVARLRGGLDFVTVFGGDGTVREVVKGLGDDPLPIGIIPFGTVNVLAMDLGISFNPIQAAAAIVRGKKRRIDVGYMNGEPFLLMVSTGLDALAVHNVDLRAKRVIGRIAYVIAALATVLTYRARRVWVSIPESGVRDRGYLAIVANSRFYAGPYRIADQTRIDDGLLDVVVFKRRSVAATLRLLAGMLFNRTRFLRDVAYYRCTSVELSSRRRQKMQMDGDKAPPTPARVWVKKRHLAVLVPRAKAPGEAPQRAQGRPPPARRVLTPR